MNAKAILRLTLSFLILLIVAVGVTAVPQYGGTLVVAAPAEPATLDVHSTTLISVQNVCYQMLETLIAYDSHGNFHPQLAVSWENSEDYKSWSFQLRQGVKFHNGKEMTAEDVKASILRWSEISSRRTEIGEIESIDVVNDYELTINLATPNALLEDTLAYVVSPLVIIPQELCATEAGKIYEPIGTGPFKFVEWKPEEEIVMERFEDYWQIADPIPYESDFMAGHKVAYVDSLIFKYVPETTARLAGLETGVFHIAREAQLGQYEQLESMDGVVPVSVNPGWRVMAVINHEEGPLTNWYLRKAIQVYLNQEDILLSVAEGHEEMMALNPSCFFVSQETWYSPIGSCYYNQHNEELAKYYLELSGYNGEPIVFMSTQTLDWIYRASIPMLEQMQDLGLNIDFQVYDWTTVKTRRQDPALWDIFMTGGGARFSPTAFHFMYGKYYGGFGPEENLAALEKMKLRPLSDFDYQYRLFEIVQSNLYTEVGTFPIGEFSLLEGWAANVESLNKGLNRLGLWNTWFEN